MVGLRQSVVRWSYPFLTAVVLATLLASHQGSAEDPPLETLSFRSIADTYVQSSTPTTNFNSDARLRADADPVRIIYLRFAVTGVNGRRVDHARLRLQVEGPSDETGGTAYLVADGTWNERTLTWNNRPPIGVEPLHALGPVAAGQIVEFVLDDVIGGDGIYNLAIQTASPDSVSYVSAAASSGQAPLLVLSVSAGPQPVVTIVQPPDGASFFDGDPVLLQATVTDDVDVALVGLLEWSSDRDGSLGSGSTASPTLSLGSHTVTAAVTDSDGFTGSDQIQVSIVPPPPANTEPLVTITTPLDGQIFTSGEPVPFSGMATDLEDGTLTAGLSWRSNRSGVIGQGGSFAAALGQGTHEVTASVTDAGGLEGSATVSFNVIPPVTLEFPPVADTYVDKSSSSKNFGTATILRADADPERLAYLRFDVIGVGARSVARATLRMTADSGSSAGGDHGGTVRVVQDTTWGERTMTHANRPALGSTALASVGAITPNAVVEFDVTAAVTGDGTYSFGLATPSTNGVDYRSREANGPRLILLLGGTAPAVAITSPAPGTVIHAGELPLLLQGAATDAEDGDLSSQIAWRSSRDGALGTGASIAASALSIGSHVITATVRDAGGIEGTASVDVVVRALNTAPVVTITEPAAAATVPAGTSLTLRATVVDDFDLGLGTRLTWTSSRDGVLGTGSPLAVTLQEGTHTVTASVTDSNGATGTAARTVTVTPTPPAVTITAPPSGAMVFAGNPVTLSGTAIDATDGNLSAWLAWSSDRAGALGTGSSLTVSTLSQGTHVITATATDAGGLVGAAQRQLVIRPPNALPVLTIVAPQAGAMLLGTTTLQGTATDTEDGNLAAQITWSSSVAGALGTGATRTVTLAPGTHTLTARVVDSAGAAVSASVTVTVGASTITLPAIADTYVESDSPTVKFGTDGLLRADASPERLAYLRFAVTGVAPFAVERALLRLTAGPDSSDASDSGGRIHRITSSTWSEAATTYANRPAVDGPVLVTKGAVARNALVEFDVTAAVKANGTYDFALTTTSSDAVSYRSREATTGAPTLVLTLKPNTPPTVVITAPADGTLVQPGAPVTLSGTAADAEDGALTAALRWRSDRDGLLGTGGSVTATTLTPGPHSITAEVTDSAGRSTLAQVSLNVSSRPVVTITAPANGTIVFAAALPLTLSGTATDVEDGNLGGTIAWRSSLEGSLGTGSSIVAGGLRTGTHTITATVEDRDRLQGTASVTVIVRAPNTAPVVTITAPASGTAAPAGTGLTLRATATDDFDTNPSASLTWTSSRQGALGTGPAVAVVLQEGSHVLTARATDSNGAIGSASVDVSIAPSAPVVTISTPANGTTIFAGTPLTFSGQALDATDGNLSGAMVWTSSRDGALAVAGSFTTATLGLGSHVITARATDAGGLAGEAQVTITVRPPNVSPTLRITAPADGTAVVAPVTLRATATDPEDGDLGAAVAWTSSVAGSLGTGATLTAPLAPGAHTLTAQVTDRDGASVTASVAVTVANPTVVVSPVADTYVDADKPTTKYGTDAALRIDASPERIIYLRFTVTGVQRFFVQRAVLQLTTGTASGDGSEAGGRLHRITNSTWSEAATTHANRPAVDGPLLATRGAVGINELVEFDVTAAVRGDGTYDFALVSPSSDVANYRSREATSGRPQLVLTLAQNSPPVLGITAPTPGTVVMPGTALILTGTATDTEDGNLAAQIRWASDRDGALGTGASVTRSAPTPGNHVVTASVTDANLTTVTATVGVVVESPPVVSVTAPAGGSNHFVTEPVTFTATATDVADGDLGAGIQWISSLDGALGTGRSLQTSALSLGTHTVRAVATDSRGLATTATVTITIEVNDPPVVVITTPAQLANFIETVPVTFRATANDPEQGDLSAALAWTSDRDGALGAGPTFTTTGLSIGTHVIRARVADNRDLEGSANVTITVEVNDPPAVTITTPVNGATVHMRDAVTFGGQATDPEDGDRTATLVWSSDRDGALGTGAGFTTAALGVGTHRIRATATDAFGLTGSAEILLHVVNDPPVVAIASPASGASPFVLNPVLFGATALDAEDGNLNAQISWASDRDGLLGTGPGFVRTDLSQGVHVITATAADSVGAVGTSQTILTVRALPPGRGAPVVTITSPPNGGEAEFGDPVTFAATALDPDDGNISAGVVWSSDVDGPFGGGASVVISSLSIAVHRVMATVNDSDGVVRSAEILFEVEVQNEPPVVTITSPLDGTEVDQGEAVTLMATATDLEDGVLTPAIVWTSHLDGEIGTGGMLTLDGLSPGTHLLDATVWDARGDAGVAQVTLVVHPIPVVEILLPEEGSGYLDSTTVTFFATAEDAADGDVSSTLVWVSDRDGGIGMGESFSTDALSLGAHTVTAVATNAHGGVGTAEVHFVVGAAVLTFPSLADAYVDAGVPTTNFGTVTPLLVDASPKRDAYFRFAVTGIGPLPVESATLKLTVSTSGSDHGGTAHRFSSTSWTESGVTYNTRPTVDGPALDTVNTSVEANDVIRFNVTGAMTGDGPYNFAILTPSTTAVRYKAREAASGQPQLVVVLAQPDVNDVPRVTIIEPATGVQAFDDAPVALTGRASDEEDGDLGTAIQWRSSLDGFLGAGPSLGVRLSRGTHVLTASVRDSFGLAARQSITVTIVDRPPQLTIAAPAHGSFFPTGLQVTFTGVATDDLDGDLSPAIEWRSHRAGLLGIGPTVRTGTLATGDHVVSARVTNSLGTVGESSVTVFIAHAPPQVAIQSPASGSTAGEDTPIALVAQATDLEDGDLSASVRWASDLEGFLGTGAALTVQLRVGGAHRITASVTDSHGLTRTDQVTLTLVAAPPAVTILTPLDGTEVSGPIGFSGTAIDTKDGNRTASLVWTSSLSGALGTGGTLAPRLLPSGLHVITARATDSDGLTGTASVSVVVGVRLPTVVIQEPVSSTAAVNEITVRRGDPVRFSATAVDAAGNSLGSAIRWTSSISGSFGTGATVTISNLMRGHHTITASATDSVGLTGTAHVVVIVTVVSSNQAPVVTITNPAPGLTVEVGTPVALSATAIDDFSGDLGAQLSWVSNLDGFLGTGRSITATLQGVGTHAVTAMVADGTGLVGTDTVAVTTTGPSLTFEAVADTYSESSSPAVNFGTSNELQVDASPMRQAYLRFSVSGLSGVTVQRAVVRMQTTSGSSAGSDHGGDLYRVSTATTWDELTLTYANKPSVTGTRLGSAGPVVSSQTVDFDVTPVFTGNGTYNFAIVPVSSDLTIYRSREASVGRPALVLFLAPPVSQRPTVNILQPANLETLPSGVFSTFRATATDRQDGDISPAVVWESDLQGRVGIGAQVSIRLNPGLHRITGTAHDIDGNSGSDRIYVVVGNRPVVSIVSPTEGAVIPFGQPVVFSGSAFDAQDGDLSAYLEWTSSSDGPLQSGISFSETLSPGTHTITASAIDSDTNLGSATVTVTITVADVGYRGHNFGKNIDTEDNRITASKPESKLWYTSDGIWWASMYRTAAGSVPAGFKIHRLDRATQKWLDTGVMIDERAHSRQDALLDGSKLYVTSRFADPPAQARLVRFTYHSGAQTYVRDAGFPVDIPGGGTEALSITRDSTGRLWTTFTLNDRVMVSHSLGSDTEWSAGFPIPVDDEDPDAADVWWDDIAGIVKLDGKIGVFWSNQVTKEKFFAVHTDGASPTDPAAWRLELAASGGSIADDHFNMKLASDGRLFVAAKTSFTGVGKTLIGLLVRSPAGTWSTLHNVAKVEFNPTRPLCILDEVRRKVHVFYSLNTSAIYTKSSSMDTIAFPDPDGPGMPFIASSTAGDINNPTGTKQNVSPNTGIVVMASSPGTNFYFHNVIDPEPVPVVTITAPASGLRVATGTSVAFQGTAFSFTDGVISSGLKWRSSISGQIGMGASFTTAALPAGTHVVTASATDSNLVTSSATVTVTVEVDVAPVVTIIQPAGTTPKFLQGQPVTFSATALDSLDGDRMASLAWTSSRDGALGTGGTISITSLSLGTHTITARATDTRGQVGSASVVVEIHVSGSPSVTITAPTGSVTTGFGATVTFAGTATDAFDGDLTAALRWVSDRDGAIGTGGGFPRSSLSLGVHRITATVTDSHGLSASASVTVTVSDPPQVTISAPAAGTVVAEGDPLMLAATASSPYAGNLTPSIVWASDRDGQLGTGGTVTTTRLSTPGGHVITATVTDPQGVGDTDQVAVSVLGRPRPVITAPADGARVAPGTLIVFGATATDPEDGDVAGALTWTSDVDGPLGTGASFGTNALTTAATHTVTARVVDSHGLGGEARITLVVNTTPVVRILGPAAGTVYEPGDPVTLTGSSTDTEDGDLTAAMVWTSDRDGVLGAGGSVATTLTSSGTRVLTATVTDATGASASAQITLEVNARPTLVLLAPESDGEYEPGAGVTFVASADDAEDGDLGSAVRWTSDLDGVLGTGATVTVTTLTSGVHTVTAAVTDAGGKTAGAQVTVIVNAAPTVTITAPASGSEHEPGDPLTLTATATDPEDGDLAAAVAWTSDLDGPLGTGISLTLASLRSGTHTITAAVTDAGGRTAGAQVTVIVNATPAVTITAPASGSEYEPGDPVPLAATATDTEDGDLTAAIAWTSSLDGALGSGAGLSLTSLRSGTHTITAAATDAGGRTASAQVTVIVDAIPTLAIIGPADASVHEPGDTIDLIATATDTEEGDLTAAIAWASSLDGALGTGGSLPVSSLQSGIHRISAAVVDTGGRAASAAITVIVNASPIVTITGPADASLYEPGDTIDLVATATDTEDGDLAAVIVWASDLDGPLGTGGSLSLTWLRSGTHRLTATVTDAGGRTASAALIVSVNATPEITITAPADASLHEPGDSIGFVATATDAEDGELTAAIAWTSDLDGALGIGGSLSISSLRSGTHRLTAAVTDTGGRSASAALTVVVDATPIVTITAPADASVHEPGATIGLVATATDTEDGNLTAAIAWTSSLDGALGTGGSLPVSSLRSGTHRLTASIIDAGGRSASAAITVIVNATPTVTITAPADASLYEPGDTVDLVATALDTEDGELTAAIAWTSDLDGPLGIGGSVSLTWLRSGTHRLTASVTDTGGRTASAATTVTVNAAPAIIITAPADASLYEPGDTVGLVAAATDPEDGSLAAAIAWTSDVDGPLGTGPSLPVSSLRSGTHRITAAVADTGGRTASAAITVIVNATPTVTIAAPADASLHEPGDAIGLVATATDAEDGDLTAAIAWTSNLVGILGTGGSLPLVSLPSGTHRVTAAVADAGGRTASDAITVIVNAMPAVAITAPADASLYAPGDIIDLVATATDTEDGDLAAVIAWTSDLDGPLGVGESLSLTWLRSGTHRITAAVTDTGGRTATAQRTVVVNASPTVAIIAPASGSSYVPGATVSLAGTASDVEDGSLTASIAWTSSLDGPLGSGGSLSLTTLRSGTHAITAGVTDSGARSATAQVTVTVNAAPTVTITSPTSGSSYEPGATVVLSATATDLEDGNLSASVAWISSLDGMLGSGASLALTTLRSGTHVIGAFVIDRGGKTAAHQITLSVNAAPSLTITSPANGTVIGSGSPVILAATATDLEDGNISGSVSWISSLDGPLGTGASLSVSTLRPGFHIIGALVVDAGGKSATRAVTVIVNVPPAVTITEPAGGSSFTAGAAVDLAGAAIDAEDGDLTGALAWSSDLDGTLGSGGSLSVSTLRVGTHVITASAVDTRGTSGTDQITISIVAP